MKGMTALMKKITWCVIYLIKVNYTIVQLHVVQKYMDVALKLWVVSFNGTFSFPKYFSLQLLKYNLFAQNCGIIAPIAPTLTTLLTYYVAYPTTTRACVRNLDLRVQSR